MKDSPVRVLVVDDLENNRYSFAQILKKEPYQVDLASSANEGLRLLTQFEYICILCDVQMPEIDGIEFAKIVRKDPDLISIPIVFITAHNFSPEKIYDALSVGAYDFIQKPIDPAILKGKLRIFYTLNEQNQKLDLQSKEISQYSKKLEEINKELEQFNYVASHDLKSPLRAISNLSSLLLEDFYDSLPEEGQKYLRTIIKRVHRMDNLLNDLFLCIARIIGNQS